MPPGGGGVVSAGQHTPGPWTWQLSLDNGLELKAQGGFKAIITTNEDSRRLAISGEADARLISAAPELLDALQALHRVCMAMNLEADHERPTEEAYLQATAQAGAAIASATGAVP